MSKPLGLYVHIPFCERKCLYCDFLSFAADDDIKKMYVDLLVDEIRQWDDILSETVEDSHKFRIKSVFIGGGTPTCLSAEELLGIGNAIRNMKIFRDLDDKKSYYGDGLTNCNKICDVEYTIEMNPGTLLESHIAAFKDMGVNRISLGLQSAQNEELQILGRIHRWEEFVKCYQMLRENGFDNLNVDLMSAIPCQTYASYKDTLEKVLDLKPEHISAYSLIVEPGTPFAAMQDAGELLLTDEDEDREMYVLTKQLLTQYGLHRYEISNYSLPEKECMHNLAYWSGGSYLGVGLGASSYVNKKRWRNPDNMKDYRHHVLEKTIVEDTMGKAIPLSIKEQMEEYMFLGMRKTAGISESGFLREFGVSLNNVYGGVLDKLLGCDLLAQSGDYICLTERGIDVSNMFLSEFILDA